MEKPGNCIAIVKLWKEHQKKNILKKGSVSLLENLVWSSFQFLLVEISLPVSP